MVNYYLSETFIEDDPEDWNCSLYYFKIHLHYEQAYQNVPIFVNQLDLFYLDNYKVDFNTRKLLRYVFAFALKIQIIPIVAGKEFPAFLLFRYNL